MALEHSTKDHEAPTKDHEASTKPLGRFTEKSEGITMAKLLNKAHAVRRRLGLAVFRKHANGETRSVYYRPESDRTVSEAQLEARRKFAEAAKWATAELADPAKLEFYSARAKAGDLPTPHAAALRDFLRPPEIGKIELSGYRRQIGDPIEVEAADDGDVVAVAVKIVTADGVAVESGAATRVNGNGTWRYATTVAAPAEAVLVIEAEARDRPGNTTTRKRILATSEDAIEAVDVSGYHGRTGDAIVVRPRAGAEITRMQVALRREDGTAIESGDADLADSGYRYLATQDVPAGTALFAEVTASASNASASERSVAVVVA